MKGERPITIQFADVRPLQHWKVFVQTPQGETLTLDVEPQGTPLQPPKAYCHASAECPATYVTLVPLA